MATNEDVKKLAWCIWDAEGRPVGKHLEHYRRAKEMLEEKERILSCINRMGTHKVDFNDFSNSLLCRV